MGSRGRVCALCLLTALVAVGPAWSAPKPDPPPVPPPAPAPAPPPPVSAIPPPVTPAVVTPVFSGPTAAQRAARKRAALRAQQRRAAQVAAKKKARAAARAAKQRAALRATIAEPSSAGFSDPESGTSKATPFLLAGLLGALLLLGVALTPARAVPWSRVSRELDDRRQELALLGVLGLVATGFFFLLAMMSEA